MRNIITSGISALVLSLAVAGTATASPNSEGGDAYASKVLMASDVMSPLVRGIEGASNDGEQSPLGLIVTRNVVHQAAATSELPTTDAE